jgi:hypothetical protein
MDQALPLSAAKLVPQPGVERAECQRLLQRHALPSPAGESREGFGDVTVVHSVSVDFGRFGLTGGSEIVEDRNVSA